MPWIRYGASDIDDAPPLEQPREGEDSLEMLDRLGINRFPDADLEAAGFARIEPGELFFSCLAEAWRGHAKHSRVVTDLRIFAIEMKSPAAMMGRLGGSKTSEAKRLAARRNIKKRWEK